MSIQIRMARPADAPALRAIYAPYVLKTAITFEYTVPDESEFRSRVENTLKKYPYIVAEESGMILGYAYASPYHPRAAYGWACESSIYLREDCHGKGLGRLLYEKLEDLLGEMGIVDIYADIAYPDKDDEHLTGNSVSFHEHMGYLETGRFIHVGYKFGRWYNTIWMGKQIGTRMDVQPPVTPCCKIHKEGELL